MTVEPDDEELADPTTESVGRHSRDSTNHWRPRPSNARDARRAPSARSPSWSVGDDHPDARSRHRREQRHLLGGRRRVVAAAAVPERRSSCRGVRAQPCASPGDTARGARTTRRMERAQPHLRRACGDVFRKHDRHDRRAAGTGGGHAHVAKIFRRSRRRSGARPDADARRRTLRRASGRRRERRVLARPAER